MAEVDDSSVIEASLFAILERAELRTEVIAASLAVLASDSVDSPATTPAILLSSTASHETPFHL